MQVMPYYRVPVVLHQGVALATISPLNGRVSVMRQGVCHLHIMDVPVMLQGVCHLHIMDVSVMLQGVCQ